ncbi:hypothetical protein E4U59_002758 [Claviceps monticola]|nr:hypothetical protein E4U59_002758 [Claviceps monticola]
MPERHSQLTTSMLSTPMMRGAWLGRDAGPVRGCQSLLDVFLVLVLGQADGKPVGNDAETPAVHYCVGTKRDLNPRRLPKGDHSAATKISAFMAEFTALTISSGLRPEEVLLIEAPLINISLLSRGGTTMGGDEGRARRVFWPAFSIDLSRLSAVMFTSHEFNRRCGLSPGTGDAARPPNTRQSRSLRGTIREKCPNCSGAHSAWSRLCSVTNTQWSQVRSIYPNRLREFTNSTIPSPEEGETPDTTSPPKRSHGTALASSSAHPLPPRVQPPRRRTLNSQVLNLMIHMDLILEH